MIAFIFRCGVMVAMMALVCASGLGAETVRRLDPLPGEITAALNPSMMAEETTVAGFMAEMRSEQLSQIINRSESGGGSFDIRSGDQKKSGDIGSQRKNPAKAFMYSALIPGAGQFYNGSKLKALVFAGVEALAWTGHISNNNKGDSKTDEFNDFADTHWSQTVYEDFLEANWSVRDDDLVVNNAGFSYFTHHLPSTKTQQYYEMIGKYNQFIYGWDDMNPQTIDSLAVHYATSQNRLDYEEMRGDANKFYDNAKTSLIVVMVNHILSGTEAALAARRHNNKMKPLAQRVSFKAYAVRNELESFPMLSMTYRF